MCPECRNGLAAELKNVLRVAGCVCVGVGGGLVVCLRFLRGFKPAKSLPPPTPTPQYSEPSCAYALGGLKLFSININSIRGRKLELLAFLEVHQPPVVAIQCCLLLHCCFTSTVNI